MLPAAMIKAPDGFFFLAHFQVGMFDWNALYEWDAQQKQIMYSGERTCRASPSQLERVLSGCIWKRSVVTDGHKTSVSLEDDLDLI